MVRGPENDFNQKEKLPAILKASPIQPDARDDKLSKLLKARYNEAIAEMRGHYYRIQEGRDTFDVIAASAQRVLVSGLELYDKPAEQVALLEQCLELAREVEKINQAYYDAGRISIIQLHRARYLRLDTEIQLLRARKKAKGS